MEEIILGVKVDTSGSQLPIAELETSLKRMKDEIKTLPRDSQAFKVLQAEIQKTDAQVKNVNRSLEGIGKAQIAEGLGKITGGATAAVAGFSLLSQALGSTKESAEEMQKSLNTAFGVVAGVKGMIEAFQGLNALMPLVTNAMTAFNTVLKANPIGLVIGAITLLTGAIAAYNLSTEEAVIKQEDFNTSLERADKSAKNYEQTIKDLNNQINGLVILLATSAKGNGQFTQLTSDFLKEILSTNKELYDAFESEISDTETKIKDALKKRLSDLSKATEDTGKDIDKLASQLSFLGSILFEYDPNIGIFVGPNKDIESQDALLKKLGKTLKEVKAEYETIGEKYTELLEANGQINVTEDKVVKELTEQLKGIQELKKNGLKTDAERNAELEKQIRLQRALQTEIDKLNFLQRENAIRQAGGIDEQRFLELLEAEKRYTSEVRSIKQNEALTEKVRLDLLKALQEQYYLDLADINKKYEEAEKERRQKSFDDYLKQLKDNLKKEQEENDKNADQITKDFLDMLKKKEDAQKSSIQRMIFNQVVFAEAISNSLQSLADLQRSIQEGNYNSFVQNQQRELDAFEKYQESRQAGFQEGALSRDTFERDLAKEREDFQLKQQERERALQKKQAVNALSLQAIQAVADIASAIIKAQKLTPPLNIAEGIRIGALGLTQIAAINSSLNRIQSLALGGIVDGPSHKNGGVKYAFGGQVTELEGGEGVINKRSMSIPGVANAASFLNQIGGGVAFKNSGQSSSANQFAMLATIINNKPQLLEAYVLEGNVTRTQKSANKIRNRAKF